MTQRDSSPYSAPRRVAGTLLVVATALVWFARSDSVAVPVRGLLMAAGISTYLMVLVLFLLGGLRELARSDHDDGAPSTSTPAAQDLRTSTLVVLGLLALLPILRVMAPGSILVVWFVAPVLVLILPGFALGLTLFRDGSHLTRLLHAPPLSLGLTTASVMWLDLAGVATSAGTAFAVSALLTLGALFLAWGRRGSGVSGR